MSLELETNNKTLTTDSDHRDKRFKMGKGGFKVPREGGEATDVLP